jgi:hypothetical protein
MRETARATQRARAAASVEAAGRRVRFIMTQIKPWIFGKRITKARKKKVAYILVQKKRHVPLSFRLFDMYVRI